MNADIDKMATDMAIGRILSIMSRPYQENDITSYEDMRTLILKLAPSSDDLYRPNVARDWHGMHR